FQSQYQIAGAAADVEHAGVAALQDRAHTAYGAGPPPAVDVEGEQMVGEVVAAGDAAEDSADQTGGFPFAVRALGSSALHARARRMDSSTRFWSIPETTVTSPMRTGSTKCT